MLLDNKNRFPSFNDQSPKLEINLIIIKLGTFIPLDFFTPDFGSGIRF